MGTRLELQQKLEEVVGSKNVYFQPPPTFKMEYPCVIYKLLSYDVKRADNIAYNIKKRYNVLVVDKDPETELPDKIMEAFNQCYFDRFYAADGLNHYSMSLYF